MERAKLFLELNLTRKAIESLEGLKKNADTASNTDLSRELARVTFSLPKLTIQVLL